MEPPKRSILASLRPVLALALLAALLLAPHAPLVLAAEQIFIQADKELLFADGSDSTAVTVRLEDGGGDPIAGAAVTFSLAPNNLGSLSSTVGVTDNDGATSVTFTAGTFDGMVTVEATVNNLSNSVDLFLISAGPAVDEIVLTASPTSIPNDDSTTTTLTAVVTAAGQPVAGYLVRFATDHPGTLGSPSATTDAQGRASTTFRSPEAGTARIKAVAEGGVAEDEIDLTITAPDTTPPAAPTITSPAEGATTGPRPTISGTAEPGASVALSVGGRSLTLSAAPDGSWQTTLTADLPGGPASLQAIASDAAGNASPAAVRSFSVDTSVPSQPSLATRLVNRPAPLLSGTADPGAIVRVSIVLPGGGTLVFDNLVAAADGRWSVNLDLATPASGSLPTNGLADGSYSVTVQARNALGTPSIPATTVLAVDTVAPPAPSLNDPGANFRVGARPLVNGTAEAGSTVVVTLDLDGDSTTGGDVVRYETTAGSSGSWSINLASATPISGALGVDGLAHQSTPALSVAARDAATNLGPPTSVRLVVLSRTFLPIVRR